MRDTAALAADGQTYMLDGVQGLGAPYADQLQAYIIANGDSVSCKPRGAPGYYVCVLGDGTDVAQVALVNGAARAAPDAPDPYYCGQRIGRMYIQLAPDVPLRPSSPYYFTAEQLLNLAVIQLCQYADDHGVYDARALEPEAHRLLDGAQRELQAQINRNVFLRPGDQ